MRKNFQDQRDRLNEKIQEARIIQAEEDIQHREKLARDLAKHRRGELWTEEFLQPRLRKATINDYKRWLSGFLDAGGEITHCYDYPFDRWHFFVAQQDIEVAPLFGAMSIQIIVPSGLKWSVLGSIGHNEIYQMDGFRQFGGVVPIFSDLIF